MHSTSSSVDFCIAQVRQPFACGPSLWTWTLFSGLFLGMLLSRGDETDEKLEKQQKQEGHLQESSSNFFSSLGRTLKLSLQLYLHLI